LDPRDRWLGRVRVVFSWADTGGAFAVAVIGFALIRGHAVRAL